MGGHLSELLALLVIASVVFMVMKCVAGLLSRGEKVKPFSSSAVWQNADTKSPSVAELDLCSVRDRPAILLRLLVERLHQWAIERRTQSHSSGVDDSASSLSSTMSDLKASCALAERILYGSSGAGASS
jgi:hypothetical protein